MQHLRHSSIWPSARAAFWLAVMFAVVLVYSSTLVGPMGIHYQPRDPWNALAALRHIGFVAHGSDQRADWMGNLLMLVPYGFLVTGALWPRRWVWLKLPALLLALLVCVATVLVVKYLQLFFPPRTVTLNYIAAQTLGSVAGCTGFVLWYERVAPALLRRSDPVLALVMALRLYFLALLVFLLMPLDFALNLPDLLLQMARLPDALTAIPGQGRPLAVRVLLQLVSVIAFMPVGMLLSFVNQGGYRVKRSLGAVAGLGLLLMMAVFALNALVLSGAPALVAALYRTFGIVLGAALLRWMVRQDPQWLRARASAAVPWLVVPYLLALAFANQLVATEWRPWQRAVADSYPLGWLPLFDYYIVTKGEAAKNIVGHLLMYAPVGAAVWLCAPRTGRSALAFALGALLSLIVEAARYLRPGLEGDINAIVVGGVAALLMLPIMNMAWSLLAELARRSAHAIDWQEPPLGVATAATERLAPAASGQVENY